MAVSAYFTRFRTLYDEYSNLSEVPHCTCDCKCGAIKLQEEQDKIQKVTQFLMGLSDCCTNVRGQILMMTPLPNMNQIYYLLSQEEKQRECTGGLASLNDSSVSAALLARSDSSGSSTGCSSDVASFSTALLSKQSGSFSKNYKYPKKFGAFRSAETKKGNLFCTHCKGTNHVRDTCFLLHGYPPRHKMHPSNASNVSYINASQPYHQTANAAVFSTFGGSTANMDLTEHQLQQVVKYLKFEGDSKISEPPLAGPCAENIERDW